MSYLRYSNHGATRNQPLSPQLVQALAVLEGAGLGFDVFSGGQDHKGHGHRRTGSTRHDGGKAADGFFFDLETGNRLSWANENERARIAEAVKLLRGGGLTGFGAGEGYMQPGSMHIGYGGEAVWGAGGKGANAPQWLRDAYHGTSPSAKRSAPLSTGSTEPPAYASQAQDTAAGTLYTGALDGAYDAPVNALASLPAPVQNMMMYNALASLFQNERDDQPMFMMTGY